MNTRARMALLAAIAALAAQGLLSGGDWDKKPFPEWGENDVIKLVTDSPWARPVRIDLRWKKDYRPEFRPQDIPGVDRSPVNRGTGPLGGIGAPRSHLPDRADIIVRWATALPVRQAKALYKQRDEKLPETKLNELVGSRGEAAVIELHGVPSEIAHQGPETVADLARQTAYLKTRSGRIVKPVKAEVDVHALTLTIRVHFPVAGQVKVEDREVEFGVDVQIFKVKERFDLRAMRYLGFLEM